LCNGYFQDSVLQTIYPGWPQNAILLISASWVTRMTGVSHQRPATMQPPLHSLHSHPVWGLQRTSHHTKHSHPRPSMVPRAYVVCPPPTPDPSQALGHAWAGHLGFPSCSMAGHVLPTHVGKTYILQAIAGHCGSHL
jgi:hypothetical protein